MSPPDFLTIAAQGKMNLSAFRSIVTVTTAYSAHLWRAIFTSRRVAERAQPR